MQLEKIEEKVFRENSNELQWYEKTLKRSYQKEKSPIRSYTLSLSTLVLLLKKYQFETSEISNIFKDMIENTQKLEKQLSDNYRKNKSFKDKMMLDIFYNNTMYKLFYIEGLYRDINYISNADKLQVLRKNLELKYQLFMKNYKNFIYLFLFKITSNYGTSFWYLWLLVFIITSLFWVLYYTFLNLWLIWNFPEEKTSFDFWMYISVVTMTNVWSDVWVDIGNSFLRVLLALEQWLWAILFWVFAMLLVKKL